MEIHYPNLTQAHARYEATEREHANKRSEEHQAALRRETVTVNAQLKTALTSFEASTSRMDQLETPNWTKAKKEIATYKDNDLRMQADAWERAAKSSLIFRLESPFVSRLHQGQRVVQQFGCTCITNGSRLSAAIVSILKKKPVSLW